MMTIVMMNTTLTLLDALTLNVPRDLIHPMSPTPSEKLSFELCGTAELAPDHTSCSPWPVYHVDMGW